jgi:hypothetical protein
LNTMIKVEWDIDIIGEDDLLKDMGLDPDVVNEMSTDSDEFDEIYYQAIDFYGLPIEIDLKDLLNMTDSEIEELLKDNDHCIDMVTDVLSDLFGFCVYGWMLNEAYEV